MAWRHFTVALAVLFVMLISALADEGPPRADRAVWEQVDIIPMPKRIRLTGRRLSLSKAVIVLGGNPSEQDQIGAKWINDHITGKHGPSLPVIASGKIPDDATLRIFVGTRETCPAIDKAAREKLFELGRGVPGECGYVIHPRKNGAVTDLLLGGADPIGALYACVTLAGLFDKENDAVVVREAELIDWPDYQIATEGWNLYDPELQEVGNRARWAGDDITQDLKDEYLRGMAKYLDRLLGWKISCFKAEDVSYWNRLSPKFLEVYKEITTYAKARGIHSLYYALKPAVGFREDLPNAPVRCLTGTGRPAYKDFVRCWSMDDDRRKYGQKIGEFAKASGLTDLGFHDWDTGGFISPARWGDRCDVCRKRWGDDFAAATINKHRILYEEIKKVCPDVRIHYTLYPYNISVLTQEGSEQYHITRYGPGPSVPVIAERLRERFTDFWVRVTKGLPADVTFCIRENLPENVRRFHKLTDPHGTFIWYKVGSEQWHTFFDESPRWAPTFYSGRGDLMFTVSLESFVPLKALAVREYAWNLKTPGATGWAQLPQPEREKHAEAKGEIYKIVLPHVVRNLFGRRAAPELTKALSLNMAMNHIFDHLPSRKRRIPVLTTYEKWKWQAEQAERGCEILDQLFKQFVASGDCLGMTPYAARRFIYIREVFHCCKWMALAKMHNMHARELAKAGKLADARNAIRLGREAVAEAREDMKRLVAERPDDPIYNVSLDRKKRPPYWKKYTPGNQVDYDVPEEMLAQTEKELTALAAAGDLPPRALAELAERDMIHVMPISNPPKIDGHLNEKEWQLALPAEAFFVYPGEQGIARAQTRAHFLRDTEALYFGATCWMPGNAPIRAEARERDGGVIDDEQVELFIMPPHIKGGYVQFQINAEGSVADKRVTLETNEAGVKTKKRDPEWNAEAITVKTSRREGVWELEMAIPLSSLGAADWRGGWRVNVCRDFKGPTRELSSIMRPSGRDFHDTQAFLLLKADSTPAPPPEIEIAVAGLEDATKTLDDRIATVIEFGLDVRSNRVLHNVRVAAEAYDAAGRLHRRCVLKNVEHLTFYWQPSDAFVVGFEQEVKSGGVRLILESDESRAERWIRLGGWTGAPGRGWLFSTPAEDGGTGDIRRGPGLLGLCNLPSEVVTREDKEPLRVVSRRRGTIEFWFKHQWQPPHPLEQHAAWMPRYVLLHCGIMRRDYPMHFNCSSITVFHDAAATNLCFFITNRSYAGWRVYAEDEEGTSWRRPGWHHLACVWDHDAKPDDWLRLYIDGKRAKIATAVSKPERLGDDKGVELDKTAFAVQLGSLNTGRNPACGTLDELRISRTARYDADFDPSPAPLKLDKDTSALFHFDDNLDGAGMTEQGTHYPIRGVAGALELH